MGILVSNPLTDFVLQYPISTGTLIMAAGVSATLYATYQLPVLAKSIGLPYRRSFGDPFETFGSDKEIKGVAFGAGDGFHSISLTRENSLAVMKIITVAANPDSLVYQDLELGTGKPRLRISAAVPAWIPITHEYDEFENIPRKDDVLVLPNYIDGTYELATVKRMPFVTEAMMRENREPLLEYLNSMFTTSPDDPVKSFAQFTYVRWGTSVGRTIWTLGARADPRDDNRAEVSFDPATYYFLVRMKYARFKAIRELHAFLDFIISK